MGDLTREGPYGPPPPAGTPVVEHVPLTFTDDDGYVLRLNVQTVPGQGRSFARTASMSDIVKMLAERGLEIDFKKEDGSEVR